MSSSEHLYTRSMHNALTFSLLWYHIWSVFSLKHFRYCWYHIYMVFFHLFVPLSSMLVLPISIVSFLEQFLPPGTVNFTNSINFLLNAQGKSENGKSPWEGVCISSSTFCLVWTDSIPVLHEIESLLSSVTWSYLCKHYCLSLFLFQSDRCTRFY